MKRTLQRLAGSLLSKSHIQRAAVRAISPGEALERRLFLSGNVTTTIDEGNLVIRGDVAANAIVVDQAGLAAGQLRITGAGGTTINGKGKPTVVSGITGGVSVAMGDGADSVMLQDMNVTGGIWIDGGAGINIIATDTMRVGDSLRVWNDAPKGDITIANTTIASGLQITTGSGGQNIALKAVEVQGETDIGSGDGADVLKIDDSTFHGRGNLWTGDGADRVEIDSNGDSSGPQTQFKASLLISLRGGDDTLQLGLPEDAGNGSVFARQTIFDGGSGRDTVANQFTGKTPGSQFWIKRFEAKISTAGGAVDTTAPVVSSTSPSVNAIDVSRNSKIAATFSEAMNPLTITDATVAVTAGDASVAGTVGYIGKTMTFTPSQTLAADTDFTVTIGTGAQDVAGNALASSFVWNFSTGSTSDTTAPTVTLNDPAANATNVALNKKIAATFSESMDPLTVIAANVTVTGTGGAAVLGEVGYAGTIMTFTPAAPLVAATTYTVTIGTGVKDLAGNALADDVVWSFTTGATVDIIAPTVTSTDPSDLKTNVALNKQVSAVFSESMDPLTVISNFKVTGPGNANVSGTVAYDSLSKTATFTPSSNFAVSTEMTATIAGGINGAEDSAGNPLASNKVWKFTTGTQIAQAPINLGRAAPFAVMARSSISSTGATQVNGDVGLNPGSAQGIPPQQVDGTIHVTDQAIINAQTDLLAAYNDAVSRTVTSQTLPGNMGGLTFTPGLYTNSTSVLISGAGPGNHVTLDAQGDPNAIFIFKMGSTLTTGPGALVILAGGAKAGNIYWQVGTSATLDTTTIFKGNILASVTITVNTGSDIVGRLLGGSNSDGSVTINASTVTLPPA